jgi:uncharacterized OB-fold protein
MPVADAQTQPFFDAAERGVLMLRKCGDCSAWLAADAKFCSECLSESIDWAESSGKGKIFTFGIVHQQVPGWENDTPFNVTVVQLDEGVRMTTNMVGCANEDLQVGMPVAVTFVDAGNGSMIPKFQPE